MLKLAEFAKMGSTRGYRVINLPYHRHSLGLTLTPDVSLPKLTWAVQLFSFGERAFEPIARRRVRLHPAWVANRNTSRPF